MIHTHTTMRQNIIDFLFTATHVGNTEYYRAAVESVIVVNWMWWKWTVKDLATLTRAKSL